METISTPDPGDGDPDPGCTSVSSSGGPPNRELVPDTVKPQVLQWIHASKFSCHWDNDGILSRLKCHFCWPSMDQDTRSFVKACTVCTHGKSSNTPPSGLLQPLPLRGRTWSHISVDIVTGLPPSQGNTVILTIVDSFSKATHYIAIPKLPTAKDCGSGHV